MDVRSPEPCAPFPPTRRRGQASTELIIVVALVAIASISLVTLFGGNLRRLFGASTESLAGASEVEVGASDAPSDTAAYRKSLQSFGQNGGPGGHRPE
jgi:hypothetical protein